MTDGGESASGPAWRTIADRLELWISGPTLEQRAAADALSLELPENLPAPVAAVVLRDHLADALLEPPKKMAEIPAVLGEIEAELGVDRTERLFTGSSAEVSAWFSARYALKTIRGLRAVQPDLGDIVTSEGWDGEKRVVSSIRADGRVFMKRHPVRSAWPNHLTILERPGSAGYAEALHVVDAEIRNSTTSTSTNPANFADLEPFALKSHVPAPEAIRALEELLESGERLEEPLQELISRYPELLASTVMGGWKTYVVPKQRLGAEFVPDFLVLGINSIGPQWVTVEIEAARHKIVNKNGSLSPPTRHAVQQIQDWREWLTDHVAYAQIQHKLYGLTNRAPGLVIIGRDKPSTRRIPSRAQSEEGDRIAIHSWDWLLRNAKNLGSHALMVSDFALENTELLERANWKTAGMSTSTTFQDLVDESEADPGAIRSF